MKEKLGIILFLVALVLSLLGLWLMTEATTDNNEDSMPQAERLSQEELRFNKLELQRWPLSEDPGEWPAVGRRPALPHPPTGYTGPKRMPDRLLYHPYIQYEVLTRMDYLVRNHPYPAMTKMAKLLDEGDVMLEFVAGDEDASWNASFYAAAAENGPLPVVRIDINDVLAIDEEKDWLIGMVVLYHEFVHYEQWADTRAPVFSGNLKSDSDCEDLWYFERQAYERSCALQAEWDLLAEMSGDTPICNYVRGEFDHALFIHMWNANRERRPGMLHACGQAWAIAAGHPHPEAFE
jgi:hypothetical protein